MEKGSNYTAFNAYFEMHVRIGCCTVATSLHPKYVQTVETDT